MAKRLVQGKDWHGWAWYHTGEWDNSTRLFFFAESRKPKDKPTESGRWIRVKFTIIDKTKRRQRKAP